MDDIQLLETRYQRKEHLIYPEMVRAIDKVMKNPDCEIEIPDNFLERKYRARSLFVQLITTIRITLAFVWIHIASFFSKEYGIKYRAAVKKIATAYDKKIEQIYKLAISSINEQDRAVYLKNQKCGVEKELEKKRELYTRTIEHYRNKLSLKEQIVRKAESLQEYSQGGFFKNLLNYRDVEALKREIIALDPAFNVEDINRSLALYDENSPNGNDLVKELKRLRLEQQQLARDIQELEHHIGRLNAGIEEANTKNETIIANIKTLTKIEDFIPYIDEGEELLLGNAPAAGAAAVENEQEARSSDYLGMIQDFQKHTNCRDLTLLWALLLNNFEDLDRRINSWRCSDSGHFTLKLNEPLKIWLDSDDPKGGCIFLFGDTAQKEVKGCLSGFSIAFDEGFDSYCITRIAMIDKRVRPKMGGITYESSQRIHMPGTYMGITKTNVSSLSTLKDNWKNKTEVVPSDYPGGHPLFMEKKYKSA